MSHENVEVVRQMNEGFFAFQKATPTQWQLRSPSLIRTLSGTAR